jgi:hypothetical protein
VLLRFLAAGKVVVVGVFALMPSRAPIARLRTPSPAIDQPSPPHALDKKCCVTCSASAVDAAE